MLFEHSSYRSFLKALLAEKVQKNPSYSLRRMAQQLGIQNSQLSEVMSGKANFSLAATMKVAHHLNLKPEETDYFFMLVQHESESDINSRDLFLQRINRFRALHVQRSISDLTVDQFKQISEWYHSAILELVELDDFKFTVENIALTLDISKLDAEVALERLFRLELIRKNESGQWIRLPNDLLVRSPIQSKAFRMFYRQMLDKASIALESQTPDERLSGYETLTLSKETLKEARELYEKFLDDMSRISRKSKKKTDVYHVLVHCFNLTPKKSKEKKDEAA